ncbi:hypothetical protein [Streptomyces sp. MH13]
MARLDAEGLLGTGCDRRSVVVHVEAVPPGTGNDERAQRLNPPEVLGD